MRLIRPAITLVLLLLIHGIDVHAQWVLQSASFPAYSDSVGIDAICAVDTNVVWALANAIFVRQVNQFARTTNGGTTWRYETIAGTAGLENCDITAVDGQTAWVTMNDPSGMSSGGVFKTTDGGTTWQKQATAYPGSGSFPFFIHFWTADIGLVIGERNDNSSWQIYTTTNGGALWTPVPPVNIPPPLPLESFGGEPHVHAFFQNTFWFGTDNGRVFRSTDQGHNWIAAEVAPPTKHVVHSIAFQDDSVGLATYFSNGQVPTTYRTTTGGRTWLPIDPPLVPRPHILAYVPGTISTYVVTGHLIGGDIPGSAYTLNGGLSWTTVDNRTGVTPVFVTPTVGWVWADADHSGEYGIYKWTGTALVPSLNARLLPSRSTLVLATTELGRSSDTSVVSIYSGGMSPLSISRFALLHGQASFQTLANPKAPATIAPGAADVVKIVFTPTGPGVVNDTLAITSNDPVNPVSLIALRGDGYSVGQAQTGVLYAVSGGPVSSRLASVNQGNGAATTIGQTGYAPIVSMAVHPSTREIIGLVATGSSNSSLVRINASGGDAHALSAITIPNPKGMTFGQDGVLYVGTYNARIYGMNYMTGVLIDTAFTNPPIRIAGLASNRAGELWACVRPSSGPVDGIYKIDFASGKSTLVGATGLGGGVLDILFYNGNLYGITDSAGLNRNSLIQINTATGVGTVIGRMGSIPVQALAAIPAFITSVREVMNGALPVKTVLEQNYPNPFNPATTFEFSLPLKSFVSVKVFDALGREVATLASEEMSAGSHTMRWDAGKVPSGIYYYRLQAGAFTQTGKAVLLK